MAKGTSAFGDRPWLSDDTPSCVGTLWGIRSNHPDPVRVESGPDLLTSLHERENSHPPSMLTTRRSGVASDATRRGGREASAAKGCSRGREPLRGFRMRLQPNSVLLAAYPSPATRLSARSREGFGCFAVSDSTVVAGDCVYTPTLKHSMANSTARCPRSLDRGPGLRGHRGVRSASRAVPGVRSG